LALFIVAAFDDSYDASLRLLHFDSRNEGRRNVESSLASNSPHSPPRVSSAVAMSTSATPQRARDDGADPSAVTPAAKRPRQGSRHHPSEYIPGSVMKVKLHNFMTYSDVEMEPGPRLNVILGPNGTGKSSFVCALAIGLAGSTKLLGRADKLSEFVKRGEQSGYSEITLATKDANRPLVVRREIKRKDSSSTWRVNSVVVKQERVKEEMHKLGVQLDNLCQFLPQDRVVEFARLTPEALLKETEKAIGNAELHQMHEELSNKKRDIAGLEREVRRCASRFTAHDALVSTPTVHRPAREILGCLDFETWHPEMHDFLFFSRRPTKLVFFFFFFFFKIKDSKRGLGPTSRVSRRVSRGCVYGFFVPPPASHPSRTPSLTARHRDLSQVTNKRAKIEKLKSENESVGRDVTRFNEREKLRATAREMKTKVPWLIFGRAKTLWANSKTELTDLKKRIIAEEEKLKRFKTPMTKVTDETKQAVAKLKKTKDARKALLKKQVDVQEVLDSDEIAAEALMERLHRAKESANQRERKIRQREKTLRDVEAARARCPSVPEGNDAEVAELRKKRAEMNTELRGAEDELEDLNRRLQDPMHTVERLGQRLNAMNSVRGQRLNKAKEVSKRYKLQDLDAYVRENENYFVKPVLGPILTLMECADVHHRNMLSQTIPNWMFGAYVIQTKADYEKIAPVAGKLGCDVLLVENASWTEPDISHLKPLGVTHRLDQAFTAPAAIKTALCEMAALHKAYALKKMPGAQVEKILKETEVMRAFTPDAAFNVTKSRYDANAISISSNDLRRSNTFQGGIDTAEKADMERRIQEAKRALDRFDKNKAEIQDRKKKLEHGVQQAMSRIQNLNTVAKTAKDEMKRLDTAVATAKAHLERESRATDVEKIEREVKKEMSALMKKRVATCVEIAEVTRQLVEKTHEYTARSLRCRELDIQGAHFKAAWDKARETSASLRDALGPAEDRLKELKETARELRIPAMEATNGRDPGKDEALEAQFAKWDNDLNVLEESIRMFEDEADAIMCPNEAVLEDYKARQRHVEEIENSLVDQEKSLHSSIAEITEIKNQWLPRLRALIENINENFKQNFASIGCAGEVRLREDPTGDDFDLWKLEIWVKFRAATDMHILDAHRQSGGERSVSTMLYLISLQELTRAPFRVVDEINQGMDPVNERKIFKRMTDAASKDSTPQTFLLTPKLLNNLKYTEDCTVLCIFNGPYIAQVAERWREIQSALQPVASPNTPE